MIEPNGSSQATTGATDVRKRLFEAMARRAHSAGVGASMPAVARLAYEDLAVVLVPLVSQAGFDALVARAFHLAQREYPAAAPSRSDAQDTDPFVPVALWLERQDERNATDAAAAMFEALAALLTTLIGESLTTQYLRKAWPEDFSAGRSKGKRA